MLKKLMILIIACPHLVMAADPPNVTRKTITVTGSVYRSCRVEISDPTLQLGDHRASSWRSDANWLNHGIAGHSQTVSFFLRECDRGTTVKVSATGAHDPNNPWMLKNTINSASDLYVGIQLVRLNDETIRDTLPLTGSVHRTFTTINSADDVTELKIHGSFRRINNALTPVGTFQAPVVIIFTFE
jgi:type 1 fimbria pilin